MIKQNNIIIKLIIIIKNYNNNTNFMKASLLHFLRNVDQIYIKRVEIIL